MTTIRERGPLQTILRCSSVAVCCRVLQCVAVCCNMLQCATVCCAHHKQCWVATISRIDKMIGLFCRISSLLKGFLAKVTFNFIDPTNLSHPILRYSKNESFAYAASKEKGKTMLRNTNLTFLKGRDHHSWAVPMTKHKCYSDSLEKILRNQKSHRKRKTIL